MPIKLMASKLIELGLLGWEDILEDGNFLWESARTQSQDIITAAHNPPPPMCVQRVAVNFTQKAIWPEPERWCALICRFTHFIRAFRQPYTRHHRTPVPYTQVRDRVQLPRAHGIREERARSPAALPHRAAADHPRPALRRVAGVWRTLS